MGVCNQLETSAGWTVLAGHAHGNLCCLAARQLCLGLYGVFLEPVALFLTCGLARLCLHLMGWSTLYPARSGK